MADQVMPIVGTNGKGGFFDAVNGDRTYSAEDMNELFSRLVTDGVYATPQGTPSTDFKVRAAGQSLTITIEKGRAKVADKWVRLDNAIVQQVAQNGSGLQRVDSAIIRINSKTTGRCPEYVFRQGTPGEGAPPLSTDPDYTELRLANITVNPGVAQITDANITDTRGSSECPWVTSLVEQVDTSALWAQYQAAYSEQYASYTADYIEYTSEQRQAWQDFIESLTDDLTVATNVMAFSSSYTAAGTTTTVPIGLSSYDPATDVLFVFINGLMAAGKYTVSPDNLSINLTNAISAGTVVSFLCLKSVIGGDIASTLSAIQALDARLTASITDTGWVTLELLNGATAESGMAAPAYRKIGKTVYLKGGFTGVSTGTTAAMLPVTCCPASTMLVSTFAADGATGGINVIPFVAVVRITTAGEVVLHAVQSLRSGASITDSAILLDGFTFAAGNN